MSGTGPPGFTEHGGAITRIMDMIDRTLIVIAGILLIIVTVTVLLQVTMRYVFDSPTSWSEELAMLAFVWFVMVAIAPTLRHNEHIKVEFLTELPIRALTPILRVLASLAVIALFAILGYYATELMPSANRQQLTGISRALSLKVPLSTVYWAVPVGSLFTALFAIEKIFKPTAVAGD